MNWKTAFAIMILSTAVVQPAKAIEAMLVRTDMSQCEMNKNMTLGINFNNVFVTAEESGAYVQTKITEIETIAKENGVEKILIQNMNYNINSVHGSYNQPKVEGQFRLHGNINFQLQGDKEPVNLLKALDEKGYNVNFRVNANRQCR